MSRAANPLSIYCSAQTAHPLPIVKNRNPTIALLINCLVVLLLNLPVRNVKIKIIIAADTKRMPANKNGGISWTTILLNRYVDPQII